MNRFFFHLDSSLSQSAHVLQREANLTIMTSSARSIMHQTSSSGPLQAMQTPTRTNPSQADIFFLKRDSSIFSSVKTKLSSAEASAEIFRQKSPELRSLQKVLLRQSI